MKHIPNIISLCRIIILFVLFFTYHNKWLFLILYLICGLSDVLDGYIARKTNTQSEFGARLDSLADILLFTVITVFIIQWMGNKILIFLPLIIITALIRCASIAIAAYKYHSFASLHTWGNKLTGFLLFITPLFILFQLSALLWVVCLIAVLSAAEECIIHITSPEVDLNVFSKSEQPPKSIQ